MSSPPPLPAMIVITGAEKGRLYQQGCELAQLAQGLLRAGAFDPLVCPGFAGRLPGLAAPLDLPRGPLCPRPTTQVDLAGVGLARHAFAGVVEAATVPAHREPLLGVLHFSGHPAF